MDKEEEESNQAVKEQFKGDEALLATLRERIKGHIDPYPFVLEVVAAALTSGKEAGAIGESEINTLRVIQTVAHRTLQFEDPASASIL